jgi:serine/threonine-protein kinase
MSKVPKGTAVGLVVSSGRVAAEISVPDLVGKSVVEAEKTLLGKGLKKGNVTYQTSFDLLPNTVVDQFPRAGDSVPEGQAVDLFVVKSGKPREEIEEKK